MKVSGKHYRTIWLKDGDEKAVSIIDQRFLPHKFVVEHISSANEMITAIKDMHVRGAGLIGAAAGYGMYLAAQEAKDNISFGEYLQKAADALKASRPTAVNLEWAVNRQLEAMASETSLIEKIEIAKHTAAQIADEDAGYCKRIGDHGVNLIEQIAKEKKGKPVNILTHCNAGWLAFVDYGSALSPVYEAFGRGIKVHVWVSETRPRNQGANLTAWELLHGGISHTLVADNTSGHLLQNGLVDFVITGADRVTRTGDAANKVGTYLKALAAYDNLVPFYVALPSSTFDWNISYGLQEIKIEERNGNEVKYIEGLIDDGIKKVLVAPASSPALNYAFDVTPARLITGLITERGICNADEQSILELFPERK